MDRHPTDETPTDGAPVGQARDLFRSPHTGRHVWLTPLERAILEFERQPFRYAGPKEGRIRDELQVMPSRYYQLLNVLVDDPRGMEYDPVLCQNLRAARARRRHL